MTQSSELTEPPVMNELAMTFESVLITRTNSNGTPPLHPTVDSVAAAAWVRVRVRVRVRSRVRVRVGVRVRVMVRVGA